MALRITLLLLFFGGPTLAADEEEERGSVSGSAVPAALRVQREIAYVFFNGNENWFIARKLASDDRRLNRVPRKRTADVWSE